VPTPVLDNRQLGSDVQRPNLLVNGGFEFWQRGNGPFTASFCADRWALWPSNGGTGGTTISCSRDTANAEISGACAAITPGGTAPTTALPAQIYQYPAHQNDGGTGVLWGQVYGRPLSLALRVKTSVANAARAMIQIASNPYYGSYHTGNGQYQTLTVSVTAAQTTGLSAVGPTVALNMEALGTYYIDSAMLVIGSQPCDYVPMSPADDLARCKRYYQRWASGQGNTYLGTGSAQSATVGYFMFGPWPVTLAVTPSLSYSAVGDFVAVNKGLGTSWPVTAISAPVPYASLAGPILLSFTIGTSSLVGGDQVYFVANATTAWLSLEANP